MSQVKRYTEGQLRLSKQYDDEEVIISLPHSCGAWKIGGPYEATLLLQDLQRMIPLLQAERTTKGSSGVRVATTDGSYDDDDYYY